ncbi:MAG TPA: hypothetical protein VJS44_01415 [Pyrinomonadaceae bacterium]|nr:hypothetical protein [Pyrinomonadaceae bacterium]
MKRVFLITLALILFSLAFTVREARACEPCTKDASINFEETARRADLIIIGQRYDFRPDELKHGTFGPENIRVQVRRIFKGEEGRDEITVKSWSGMCPYGVILNDNLPHVIFLKKSGDTYHAIDMCSVKDYLIRDDVVEFGKQKISIEDFRMKLEKVLAREGN